MTRHPGAPFDPNTEETFHLAGDKPIVEQGKFGAGYASQLNLSRGKTEVQVRYKDFLMTCDLYQLEGAPMRLILLCPRCRNTLSITGDKKQMSYDPHRLKEFGGSLHVEPFTCTWELDPSKDGRRMEFGLGLCNWRAAIDANVAKDA